MPVRKLRARSGTSKAGSFLTALCVSREVQNVSEFLCRLFVNVELLTNTTENTRAP